MVAWVAASKYSGSDEMRRTRLLASQRITKTFPKPGTIVFDETAVWRGIRSRLPIEHRFPPVYAYHVRDSLLTDEFIVHREDVVFVDTSIHIHAGDPSAGILQVFGERLDAFEGTIDESYANESAMVFHNEGGWTWGHFVVQNVPRALAYLSRFPDGYLAVPRSFTFADRNNFARLLARCGIPEDRLLPVDEGKRYRFRELVIVDYLYDFAACIPRSVVLDWLTPRHIPAPELLIFVERVADTGRQIENRDAVRRLLRRFGVRRVCLGDRSLAEQEKVWSRSKLVVCVQGSDLTNMVFANPQTQLLVLSPDCIVDHFFYNLATLKGLNWHELRCGATLFDDQPKQASFSVDLRYLEALLIAVLGDYGPKLRSTRAQAWDARPLDSGVTR